MWEEAIILLPDACQSAFLSATIPNALEFAQWVANIHKKKCHVVYTDFRPVPLQHFIMPCGGEKAPLYCVVRASTLPPVHQHCEGVKIFEVPSNSDCTARACGLISALSDPHMCWSCLSQKVCVGVAPASIYTCFYLAAMP